MDIAVLAGADYACVMRTMPEGLEMSALVGTLADGWGLEVATADYTAVGGGSYHWVVRHVDGARRFVTVDDLDQKPWLGDSRDAVFAGLRRAFDTAGALDEMGLVFVVAPIRTDRGETVRPHRGAPCGRAVPLRGWTRGSVRPL